MKILNIHYSEITQIGGINKSIKRVTEELVKKGHQCTVLTVNPGNLRDEEYINGVQILRIKSPVSRYLYGFSPAMCYYLTRNLKKNMNPDIIHIHSYHTLLTPGILYFLKNGDIPIVFSPHYNPLAHNTFAGKYLLKYYELIGKLTFEWVNKIVVNSELTQNQIKESFDIDTNKIEVIPHGVDNIYFLNENRKEKKNGISLLYVGVLMELKGVQYIIQSLRYLLDRGNNTTLTIIGNGDYKRKLENLAQKLNVEKNISWYDHLFGENLYQKYKEVDIFLLLSRAESYGITVAEALASGVPCIISKTSALKEFLNEPGCFCIDYTPDPEKLADLIIKIHQSNVNVGPFTDKIKTWDEVAIDYEKLYKNIVILQEFVTK